MSINSILFDDLCLTEWRDNVRCLVEFLMSETIKKWQVSKVKGTVFLVDYLFLGRLWNYAQLFLPF